MLKIYKDNDGHKNDTKVSAPTPFFFPRYPPSWAPKPALSCN